MKYSSSLLLGLVFSCTIAYVQAACSAAESAALCTAASKAAFASAFAAAAAEPLGPNCYTMTAEQWEKVGCDIPASHKSTKICVPDSWTSVLELFAKAIPLKTKILVKDPYTMDSLFGSSRGRALIRHELAHVHQQDDISAYKYGYHYITEYCDAGCSKDGVTYEIEADKFENDVC